MSAGQFEFVREVLEQWKMDEHLRDYVPMLEEYVQKGEWKEMLYKVYDISWEISEKLYHTDKLAFVFASNHIRWLKLAIDKAMGGDLLDRVMEGVREVIENNPFFKRFDTTSKEPLQSEDFSLWKSIDAVVLDIKRIAPSYNMNTKWSW